MPKDANHISTDLDIKIFKISLKLPRDLHLPPTKTPDMFQRACCDGFQRAAQVHQIKVSFEYFLRLSKSLRLNYKGEIKSKNLNLCFLESDIQYSITVKTPLIWPPQGPKCWHYRGVHKSLRCPS